LTRLVGRAVGVLVRRRLDRRLDLGRRRAGVRLEELGDDPGDVRRGHRGAGDRVVVAAVLRVEPAAADRQVHAAGRGDVLTGGGDVGVGRLVAALATAGE